MIQEAEPCESYLMVFKSKLDPKFFSVEILSKKDYEYLKLNEDFSYCEISLNMDGESLSYESLYDFMGDCKFAKINKDSVSSIHDGLYDDDRDLDKEFFYEIYSAIEREKENTGLSGVIVDLEFSLYGTSSGFLVDDLKEKIAYINYIASISAQSFVGNSIEHEVELLKQRMSLIQKITYLKEDRNERK